MTTAAPIALPVSENSQIGEARRTITRLAAESGLSNEDCARVGLIVTELGTNLVKHAKTGELLARSLAHEGGTGISIYSIDRGPGMRNLEQCQTDGYSTAGSSGIGLGSLKRQSDTFNIYSLDQVGTVINVTVSGTHAPASAPSISPPHTDVETGLVISPITGETECGDNCVVIRKGNQITLAMVDGLGHGPNAALAADEGLRVVREFAGKPPADLMMFVNDVLKKTRGGAVTLATIDLAARQLSYCSVGNITTSLVRYGYSKTLPSSNGIVGHILPRLENVTMPWTGQDLLVMHSDGIQTPTRVFNLPGLLVRPVPLIAGMIYGQHKRGRDDASVLAVRTSAP